MGSWARELHLLGHLLQGFTKQARSMVGFDTGRKHKFKAQKLQLRGLWGRELATNPLARWGNAGTTVAVKLQHQQDLVAG